MASTPPALRLDQRTLDQGLACVHCGLCLPACPTYTENGLEADSPRGRIQLMLGLHEGKIEPTESVRRHLDLCLDCRACETACPSNVVYHELIEETRSKLPPAKRSLGDRIVRSTFQHVLTRPSRLKLTLLPARLLQKTGVYGLLRRSGMFKLLPAGLRKMEGMLPETGPIWPRHLPAGPQGERKESSATPVRAIVCLLPTCVGSVMANDINRMAMDLLSAAGCRVESLPASFCCGAIHHHNGIVEPAEQMAQTLIDAVIPPPTTPAVPPAEDSPRRYVVTTVAGCGAMLRDYGHLLRDSSTCAARARQFADSVRDVTELLAELGLPEIKHPVPLTATYHDACHLVHAQKVAAQPRTLLAKVPGLTLLPLPEADMCCGAAGTYNLTQPTMAGALAERKLRNIAATGAEVCIAGNVGCSMHIQSAAREQGRILKVVHPVEILHRAVFGET